MIWRNIPARWWLWKHQWHEYRILVSDTWQCSCGSVHRIRRRRG